MPASASANRVESSWLMVFMILESLLVESLAIDSTASC